MRHFIILCWISLFSKPLLAQQKQVVHYNQLWYAYNNNTRLTDRWGIWMDIQNKDKSEFVHNFDVKENTLGAIYYLKNKMRVTSAFTYIQSYPNDQLPDFYAPEYRPWQMIQWRTNLNDLSFAHWVRVEERFRNKTINGNQLSNEFDFNLRFRYNVFIEKPLTIKKREKGALSLSITEEMYLNYGKNIIYNTFDQNRVFGGFVYYFNTSNFLQFGYTNVIQHLPSKDRYKGIDAIKLTFFNNLDLRKKNNVHKS